MNPPSSSRVVRVIDRLREQPHLLRAVFFTSLGFFVLYDVFASRHAPHFVGDQLRGFWALFGLVGTWVMTRFMKGIGHLWLMKPEGYDGHEGED